MFAQESVMEIQNEKEAFERFKAKQIGIDYETLKKDLDDCEKRFPNNRYAGWNFKSDWELWQAAKAQAVPETLKNDCMIGQTWFMKGTPVANLIKHAEQVYKAEAITQNSKIKFGTDDNRSWFAYDVPFFGTVQMDQIEEHGIVEWDIHFNECWQGPFNSKARCIQHLEECIQEMREEQAQEG